MLEFVAHGVFAEVALLLFLAAAVGLVGVLLRQPLIVSFIAVGLIAGPSLLDIVQSKEEIELLAELGIASAKAVAEGNLQEGRDGLTYLANAVNNGIHTELSDAYAAEVVRSTGVSTLNDAIQQLTERKDATAA